MAQQITDHTSRVARPSPGRTWEPPPATPRRRSPWRVLTLTVAAVAAVLLSLGAGALSQQRAVTTPDLGLTRGSEFSSRGSADLHAFDRDQAGVVHVLFVEARWTMPKLRQLRVRAEAWRQTVTVQLPEELVGRPVGLDHWASDLPGAHVEVDHPDPATATVTVTTAQLENLDPRRLYRTQLLLRSSGDLDGTFWSYREDIEHSRSAGRPHHFDADESSRPRQGIAGWCTRCYVEWPSAHVEVD